MKRTCNYCGNTFESNDKRQKFCSVECATRHRQKKMKNSSQEYYKELMDSIAKS